MYKITQFVRFILKLNRCEICNKKIRRRLCKNCDTAISRAANVICQEEDERILNELSEQLG